MSTRAIQRGDIAQITPIYFEKEQEREKVFYEVSPHSIHDPEGRVYQHIFTWGNIDDRGQMNVKERVCAGSVNLNHLIRVKVRSGYTRVEKAEFKARER